MCYSGLGIQHLSLIRVKRILFDIGISIGLDFNPHVVNTFMAGWIPKRTGIHSQNADGKNIDRGSQVEFNVFPLPIGRGGVPYVGYITDCQVSICYCSGRARAIYRGSRIHICVRCNIQSYYIVDDDLRDCHEAIAEELVDDAVMFVHHLHQAAK